MPTLTPEQIRTLQLQYRDSNFATKNEGKSFDPEFLQELNAITEKHNAEVGPTLTMLNAESMGMGEPGIKNKAGGSASGLFQIMPPVAKELGTTVEKIRKMDWKQQLPLLDQYLTNAEKYSKVPNGYEYSYIDPYAAVAASGSLGKDPDGVMYADPSKEYKQNAKVWDINKDGKIQNKEPYMAAARKFGSFSLEPEPDVGDILTPMSKRHSTNLYQGQPLPKKTVQKKIKDAVKLRSAWESMKSE